ncbi:hypothetical protein C8K44_11653 [Aminobacter sp. AP02]|nr:hypothetical protein C8K44_11653 [Aminobacter sp. AP02]
MRPDESRMRTFELGPSLLWHTPTTESHSVRQVSWLAGRSPIRPSSRHVNASDIGAIGSPLTVAGQLRFHTGFPLSFHPWGWKTMTAANYRRQS